MTQRAETEQVCGLLMAPANALDPLSAIFYLQGAGCHWTAVLFFRTGDTLAFTEDTKAFRNPAQIGILIYGGKAKLTSKKKEVEGYSARLRCCRSICGDWRKTIRIYEYCIVPHTYLDSSKVKLHGGKSEARNRRE
ncbi:unnamed protein product [Nezara viridula]|uniref:Uncharacterized protein n=1 Tax=Nezara viridula TaxID=85310 RepID=A0A9P0H9F2_NEZVI|nr:unnamed protein product [Nezara viridula]